MHTYTVKVDGETVWTDTIDGDATVAHFPDHYTTRPDSGAVHLIIDDEIVGVQIPLIDEMRQIVAAHDSQEGN